MTKQKEVKEKMKIRKKIIQIGNSQGIIIDNIIMEGFGFRIGDIVDISDIFKIEQDFKKLPVNQTIKQIKRVIKYG